MKKKKGKGIRTEKIKEVKTKEVRLQETIIIRKQINELGLAEGNSDVKLFFTELDRFVASGQSWTGKIPLYGYNRIIEGILTTKPQVTSNVKLIYDKDI